MNVNRLDYCQIMQKEKNIKKLEYIVGDFKRQYEINVFRR